VPLLGDIPLLGNLFKTRQAESKKQNLMIFIRPKILRNESQAAYQTDSKYNFMIDQQKAYNKGELDVPLLPGQKKPLLDKVDKAPSSDEPEAQMTPDEQARAARKRRDEAARKAEQWRKEEDEEALRYKQQQSGTAVPPQSRAAPAPGLAPPGATSPNSATTHPDGEPPYATEKPGVLMPSTSPPPNTSSQTPPQGQKQ
jgi:hypothetical protein